VKKARALTNLRSSGLIGMSPITTDNDAELFLDGLYNAGTIKQKVISFYITDYYKAVKKYGYR